MVSTASVARVPPRHLRRRRPFALLVAAAAVVAALYQTLRIPETRGPVGAEGVLVRARPGRALATRGKR